ncbi:MAG: hypothetical protein SRB1_00699 [Desulfobacteraceae bacterium Eth-SRB1]|nr:MAG: hypothetical protein SRB1_00699 [Desulfobacteraceae bacterium Eth-SRB1]
MERKKSIRHFRDLEVYRRAFDAAMQEASETQCWLEFCLACRYINQDVFDKLDNEYEQLIAMLNSMEMNAAKFCY